MGDKFLGVSIGRGLGALKGLICIFPHSPEDEKKKKNYSPRQDRRIPASKILQE